MMHPTSSKDIIHYQFDFPIFKLLSLL